MVNTESTNLAVFFNKPVTTAVLNVVSETIQILSTKLKNEAGIESVGRISGISRNVNDTNIESVVNNLDKIIITPLAGQFALITGINVLNNSLFSMKCVLEDLFSRHIRKYVNTITSFPAQSTLAADLLIYLKNTAAVSQDVYENNFNELWSIADTNWKNLQLMGTMVLGDLAQFVICQDAAKFTNLCINQYSELENYFVLVHKYAKMTKLNFNHVSSGLIQNFNSIKNIEDLLHKEQLLDTYISQGNNMLAFGKMREIIIEKRFIALLENAENIVEHLAKMIDIIMSLENQNWASDTERNLKVENLLYTQCLGKQLMRYDEHPTEVEKLSGELYLYACKNNVACIDLLDEEILNINACINRENLAKARLRVRLDDVDFPLSVSHKNATLQAINLSRS